MHHKSSHNLTLSYLSWWQTEGHRHTRVHTAHGLTSRYWPTQKACIDSRVSSNCKAASRATTGSSPANWAETKGTKAHGSQAAGPDVRSRTAMRSRLGRLTPKLGSPKYNDLSPASRAAQANLELGTSCNKCWKNKTASRWEILQMIGQTLKSQTGWNVRTEAVLKHLKAKCLKWHLLQLLTMKQKAKACSYQEYYSLLTTGSGSLLCHTLSHQSRSRNLHLYCGSPNQLCVWVSLPHCFCSSDL